MMKTIGCRVQLFLSLFVVLIATTCLSAEIKPNSDVTTKDVKIMFRDNQLPTFTEDSEIQSQDDWYYSIKDKSTTVKKMIQQGWTLQSIVTINQKQFLIVFVK